MVSKDLKCDTENGTASESLNCGKNEEGDTVSKEEEEDDVQTP